MLRCFDNVPFKGNLRANLGHPPKLLLEVSLGKGLVGRSFNTPPGVGRVERRILRANTWTAKVSTPLPEWGGLKDQSNN
jgi:hypothetical protein